MDYKKEIDELITRRYDYLLLCAKNILKKNKKSALTPHDIVSELTLYLYNNKSKVEEYINRNKLEGFCISWMNTQGKFKSSPLNIKYNRSDFNELDDVQLNTIDSLQYEVDVDDIDKGDYELDLKNILDEHQIEKIMLIDKIVDRLTKSELILFRAYFIENLSYDKIVEKYTFYREKDGKKVKYKSKKSIYNMMADLKNKILEMI